MKKLFLVLILLPFFAGAQTYQSMPQAGYGPVKRMLFDSVLTLPLGITKLQNATGGRDVGQIRYNVTDSSLYSYTGYTWRKAGSNLDTTTIYTNLGLKLNKSDTAAMLTPYLRKADTTNKFITSLFRKTATDSVFFVKGGANNFAYKDSTGGGNIYNADGSLTSARTMTLNSQPLTFAGTTSSRFFSSGNVAIGKIIDNGYKFQVEGDVGVNGHINIQSSTGYLTNTYGGTVQINGAGATDKNWYFDGVTGRAGFGVVPAGIDSSAKLQLQSTTQGFLNARMTTTQRNAIILPATGLSIYNTTTNTNDYYNGTAWVSLGTGGGSQNLQQVTTVGNTTTTDINANSFIAPTFDRAGGAVKFIGNAEDGFSITDENNRTFMAIANFGGLQLRGSFPNSGHTISSATSSSTFNTITLPLKDGTFALTSDTVSLSNRINSIGTSGSTNIYNTNGSLTGARTMTLNSQPLYLAGTTTSTFFANGRVTIGGITDAGFKLDVVGGDARINGVRVGVGPGSATSNTVLGNNALNAATTQSLSVAIGQDAGKLLTSGNANTIIGYSAQSAATTLSSNTVVGYAAGLNGDAITAVGRQALRNVTGNNNTAMGAYAGYNVGAGTNNVHLGYSAGQYAVAKSNEIFICGMDNGSYANDQTRSAFYAQQNSTTASQIVTLNGNIGINTISPAATAVFDITSTTKGFLPPRMTTTQINAISSPAVGLVVYNTTLNVLCVYTGTWQKMTTTAM